jgi:hypothetical protein
VAAGPGRGQAGEGAFGDEGGFVFGHEGEHAEHELAVAAVVSTMPLVSDLTLVRLVSVRVVLAGRLPGGRLVSWAVGCRAAKRSQMAWPEGGRFSWGCRPQPENTTWHGMWQLRSLAAI